jgi:hypothetical protein
VLTGNRNKEEGCNYEEIVTIFGTGRENNPVNTSRNKTGNIRITYL